MKASKSWKTLLALIMRNIIVLLFWPYTFCETILTTFPKVCNKSCVIDMWSHIFPYRGIFKLLTVVEKVNVMIRFTKRLLLQEHIISIPHLHFKRLRQQMLPACLLSGMWNARFEKLALYSGSVLVRFQTLWYEMSHQNRDAPEKRDVHTQRAFVFLQVLSFWVTWEN